MATKKKPKRKSAPKSEPLTTTAQRMTALKTAAAKMAKHKKKKRPRLTSDGFVEIPPNTPWDEVAALVAKPQKLPKKNVLPQPKGVLSLLRGDDSDAPVAPAGSALERVRSILRGDAPDDPPRKRGELLQPDLALALCIGPEANELESIVADLQSDLEEMRWDGGSRAADSELIPELEKLVEQAGDPHGVSDASLAKLVKKHSAPVDSAKARQFLDEIERFSGE